MDIYYWIVEILVTRLLLSFEPLLLDFPSSEHDLLYYYKMQCITMKSINVHVHIARATSIGWLVIVNEVNFRWSVRVFLLNTLIESSKKGFLMLTKYNEFKPWREHPASIWRYVTLLSEIVFSPTFCYLTCLFSVSCSARGTDQEILRWIIHASLAFSSSNYFYIFRL